MKVGDTIDVESRYPKFSKYLFRHIGYEYRTATFIIQGIIGSVLIVTELNGNSPQMISRANWEKLELTGKNWGISST